MRLNLKHSSSLVALGTALILCTPLPMSGQGVGAPFDFDLWATSGWSFDAIQSELLPGGQFEGFRHATTEEVWSFVDHFFATHPDPDETDYEPVQQILAHVGQLAGVFSFGYSYGYAADAGIFFFGVARTSDPRWGVVQYTQPPNPTDIASGEYGHFLVPVPEPAHAAVLVLSACLALAVLKRRLGRQGAAPNAP